MFMILSLIAIIRRFWEGAWLKLLLLGLLIWLAAATALWFTLPYQPRFTLFRTEDSVVAGYSSDGRILATASDHGDDGVLIRLWNVNTGEELGRFPKTGGLADRVPFSSDGKIVVIWSLSSDGAEGTFSIIETETSHELATFHTHGWGYLTPDGYTFVFSPFGEECTKFCDIPTGQERLTLNCRPWCFSPDGRWFVSVESENELRVRSSATGQISMAIPCKAHLLYGPIISPDSAMLAGDFLHEEIKVWNAATGRELVSLKDSSCPTFSRSGKRLAVYCHGGTKGGIKLFDTTTWQELDETEAPPPGWGSISCLAGPGPDDMLVVFLEDRLIQPGRVDHWMYDLGIKKTVSAKELTEMKVFDFASWRQLADFSTEGQIHLLLNGNSFVEDSGSSEVFSKQPRECIKVFDLPQRRPIMHIALWPLPISFLAILITIKQFYRARGVSST